MYKVVKRKDPVASNEPSVLPEQTGQKGPHSCADKMLLITEINIIVNISFFIMILRFVFPTFFRFLYYR